MPQITAPIRQSRNGHKAFVLWFTGLSGSGKTTLAQAVEEELFRQQVQCYNLDGDILRTGLNKDLGFSEKDRSENVRRTAEVARLFTDAGLVVLTALISPFEQDRLSSRRLFGQHEFIEIYLDCPLIVCEQRDPKGLYKKARAGEIKNFTGIDSPYEVPLTPEIVIKTHQSSPDACVARIMKYLLEKEYL